MKLQTKIVAVFLPMVALAIGSAYVSSSHFQKISEALYDEIPSSIEKMDRTLKMDRAGYLMRYYDELLTQTVYNYAFTNKKKWMQRYYAFKPLLKDLIKQAIKKSGEETRRMFKQIQGTNEKLFFIYEKVFRRVGRGELSEAVKMLDSDTYLKLKRLYDNQLRDYFLIRGLNPESAFQSSVVSVKLASKHAQKALQQEEKGLIILIVVSIGVITCVWFFQGRFIVRPIVRLTDSVAKMGKGDFSQKVQVYSKDEIGYLADTFNKMTERLQKTTVSRDYVDNIIKSMVDTLVVLTPEGNIQTVNQSTLDLLGYKEEELIGKPFGMIIVVEEAAPALEKLIEAGTMKDYEMTYKTKSGEKIPMSFSGSVMYEKLPPNQSVSWAGQILGLGKGESNPPPTMVIGIVGIAHDLREIQSMQAMLVQSEKLSALGLLGAGVAHELNSPLTGVLSLVRTYLKEKDSDSDEYEYLIEMEKSCEHMANIIRDLNSFTRQSKGDFVELNCNEIIESTLRFSSYTLAMANIKLEKHYDMDLPLIKGDKSQLQQVIINMMTNARDALSGKGIFKITTRTTDSDKERFVEMEFSDSGSGISEDIIDKIFDPFFTTKRPGGGTGLGLSVSYSIIKNHRGNILIDSVLGKGTTFTVKLPTVHFP